MKHGRAVTQAAAVLLGILLVCTALSGCGPKGKGAEGGKASGSWVDPLSADQRRVAEEFGPPSVFGLAFGTDVMGVVENPKAETYRLEWWDYPEIRTRFVFQDGKFASSSQIPDPAEETPGEIYYSAVTPGDFSEGMSRGDVEKAVGSKPSSEMAFKPELFKGLTAVDWNGVVTAVFDDKGLVGIETRPATEGGAQ
jgi:hypothetical protein